METTIMERLLVIMCFGAVETSKTKSVIKIMDIKNVERIGWAEGLERAYEGDVFVTLPIEGWTLIVSSYLAMPDSADKKDPVVRMVNKLSEEFRKAQLFGSHKVSSTVIWMQSFSGTLQRLFFMEDGEIKINFGKPSKLEEDWELPDENSVLEIAESWMSVNPMKMKIYDNVKKKGYVGKLSLKRGFDIFSIFK